MSEARAKEVLDRIMELRREVRAMMSGDVEVDFTDCVPVYLRQKIDGLANDLASLSSRVAYHARKTRRSGDEGPGA